MYKKEAMDERPVHTFKTMHFMHLKIQNLVAKLALCKKNASLPRIYTSRLIFFLRVHTRINMKFVLRKHHKSTCRRSRSNFEHK